MSRPQAILYGIGSILGVVLLQEFNDLVCYKHGWGNFLNSIGFIKLPLLPALIALVTPNPLRAVAASVFFAPWLILAFITDCVLSYSGGGASMIYIAVLFWGTLCAILGAFLGGPICRRLGIEIYAR